MNASTRRYYSLLLLWLMALTLRGPAASAAPGGLNLEKRWIYYPVNLWVDKNLDNLEVIWRRAAQDGYNGVLLTDSKFGKLGDMDEHYFRNIARVKKLAADLKLEIVPAVFPIGYSESLLWHNPNLAEALPVRDAPFVVSNGVARCVAEPRVAFRGDFADLSKWDWHDPIVVAADGAARVVDPHGQNARVVQKLKVSPFRQYHITVRVRTRDFRGTPEVKVLVVDRAGALQSLNYANLGAKSTQDWTVHHVVFNSLGYSEVNVYFGCWGGQTGSLEWAAPSIEEAGLLNVVRRGGAPLVVTRADGTPLVEGRDFAAVVDPRMGTVPWKGAYDVWHEPPLIRTTLPEGTRLRVSYYHVITVGDGQVMICPSEPQTVALLRDQAKRMHAAWGARGYFMSHDEIRVLNWDDACARRGLEAGAIVADNVRTCIRILREVNPGGDIYVWSDMFDPHHNAHADYYLVRGDLARSWEGLDKDVIVAVWAFGIRQDSLKWFADRGHRQIIAGYYDGPPEQIRDWFDAARKVPGVVGVMYTTWENKYGDLERFAHLIAAER